MNLTDAQKLIDKYGQPAFDAAVRQVWVNLVTDAVWIVLILVAAIILWRQWGRAKAWAKTCDSFDEDMAHAGGFAIARIVPALLMIPVAVDLNEIIQIALNPQWQAIQVLASLLPGK